MNEQLTQPEQRSETTPADVAFFERSVAAMLPFFVEHAFEAAKTGECQPEQRPTYAAHMAADFAVAAIRERNLRFPSAGDAA